VRHYVELAAQDVRLNLPLAEACHEDRTTLCASVPPVRAPPCFPFFLPFFLMFLSFFFIFAPLAAARCSPPPTTRLAAAAPPWSRPAELFPPLSISL
jgi:hypothetical protein